MKKLAYLFLAALPLWGCNNDDDSPGSNAQLPPATQTGAGTFACRINGKAFIDPTDDFNCFYQYIDGGYYFGISGTDQDYKYTYTPWGIDLYSTNIELEEGVTYTLTHEGNDNVTGSAFFTLPSHQYFSPETNIEYTGELTITKFGQGTDPHIISGTFWFDVEHPTTGERVEIRDGRFDTYYTE